MNSLKRFLKNEDGTTIVEYAMISGMITMATLGAMVALGAKIFTMVQG